MIQAAALASALVPLGSVASEAATITVFCTAAEGCGSGGSYSSGANGTNVWGFFTDVNDPNTLLYTLQISGTPDIDVNLNVFSDHVGVFSENYSIAFPESQCIPLIDDDFDNTCVIFDVTASAAADWGEDGYYMEIRWFSEDELGSLTKPFDDGRNRIFKSESGNTFDQVLRRPFDEDDGYDPSPTPIDPALGGRGDTFSRFIAGRATVPEPSMLLLLGTGVAATLYRRRRRTKE